MKKFIFMLLTILSTLFLMTACEQKNNPEAKQEAKQEVTKESQKETQKIEYKKITPQQATEMMSSDTITLDVRAQSEFDEGHIPNAILLPDSDIKQKAEEVLPDKQQTILVYCRSGRRSKLAAEELIGMGYENVYDFGGILDWTGEIIK